MRNIVKTLLLTSLFTLSACVGITGADAGKRVGDWVEYNVVHPGLDIKILEPFSKDLLPISTIGKSKTSPLKHTVTFGTITEKHTLEIVGKYSKDIYLDGHYYGKLQFGEIMIKDGIVSIDGKKAKKIGD